MTVSAVVDMPPLYDALMSRMASVVASVNRGYADLVDLTAEALAGQVWAEGGIRSPEHWLVVRAGLSPRRARDIVVLASRRAELPQTAALLAQGRVSVDQAAVVARHVPSGYSAAAADLVENATVPQLTRALSRYSFDPVPQTSPAPADGTRVADTESPGLRTPAPGAPAPTDERAQLSMSTGQNGRFRLTYSAPASVGALVEQALREAKDALFTAGTAEVTLADAMAEVASRSLGAVTSASRAERYRVYVHLDTDGGWIGMGARLPDHMIDRLTCNGVLQPVWRTEGKPVSVGRAARIVPERTRRLVLSRDRGCRFPGCVSTLHLEVHHVRHWRHGGGTDIDSLVTLCGYHHDRHHEGAFTISGVPSTPGGLIFRTRHGHPVVPVVAAPAFGPWSFTTPLRPVSNPVPEQPSEQAGVQRSDPAAGTWSGALQVSRSVADPPVEEVTVAPQVPMDHLSDPPAGYPPDPPGWRGPTGEHLRAAYLHLAPDPPDRAGPHAPTGPASTPDPADPAAGGVDPPP